ncbi:O-antigen ligase family protein [Candidatus Peregrinibacteria bacterium]|nr:O-antigen ligase family protein [Candidatus Peregrinibacteria bacterium]
MKRESLLHSLPLILILGIIAYSALSLSGKKYDNSSLFFSTLACVGVSVLVVFLCYRKNRESARKETGLLLLFILLFAISWYLSETRTYGFSELLVWTASLLLYMSFAHTTIQKKWFLNGIVALGVVSSIMGSYFYINNPATRFSGTFLNADTISENWPNTFAFFILMIWPLVLSMKIFPQTPQQTEKSIQIETENGSQSKKKSHACSESTQMNTPKTRLISILETIVKTGTIVILLTALYLTFSRAAYLIFFIQCIFLAATLRPKRKKMAIQTILTIICVVVLVIGLQFLRARSFPTISIGERLTFQNQEKATSIRERLDFWEGSVKLALEKPFFGYGPYSFQFSYPHLQKVFLALSDHPHNLFLKVAAELGIPALIVLILFFLSFCWTCVKRFKFLEGSERQMAIILAASAGGALFHAELDYNFNFIATIVLFWILLAFLRSCFAFPHLQQESKTRLNAVIAVIVLINVFFEMGLLGIEKKANATEQRGEYKISEKYFKMYEQTLFPRDYYFKRFRIFKEEGNIDLALIALEKEKTLSSGNSEAWERLGEIQRDNKKYHEALESFRKALELNPMNHFWYYWNFIDTARKLGQLDEIENIKPRVLNLLEKYEWQLKNNIHYTAKTPNARASVALYKLLAALYPNESDQYTMKAQIYEQLIIILMD